MQLESHWVDQSDDFSHSQAHHKLANVGVLLGQMLWQANERIFDDGHNIDAIGVLVIVVIVAHIVCDQLLKQSSFPLK